MKLNIGGQCTRTVQRSTLTENGGDSMLAAMFSGRHKLKTDDQVGTACFCVFVRVSGCMRACVLYACVCETDVWPCERACMDRDADVE